MLRKFSWLIATIIIVSCSKSTDDTSTNPPPPPPNQSPGGQPGRLNEPGYGKSTAPFNGTAWAPPAGVTLTTNMHWFGYCDADTNWTKKKNYIGVPNPMLEFFVVCMEFKNNTTQPVSVRFPPVMTIQSKYLETQNGFILTNDYEFLIPQQTIKRIFASVYCVNHDRRAPFDRVDLTNEFTLGPATIPASLEEITNIVRPKNITMDKILKADGITVDTAKANKVKLIQDAIWEVTDSTGLKNQTKQKLMDLQL